MLRCIDEHSLRRYDELKIIIPCAVLIEHHSYATKQSEWELAVGSDRYTP